MKRRHAKQTVSLGARLDEAAVNATMNIRRLIRYLASAGSFGQPRFSKALNHQLCV
jgi:hypothetical protein